MSLRNKLIRLAYEKPELRGDLLPLLSPPSVRSKKAGALRIYEYIADDGVMFWSFTRLSATEQRRLYLIEPRGEHFRSHITDISRLANQEEALEHRKPSHRYGGANGPQTDGDSHE